MKIEYDAKKSDKNKTERGFGFDLAVELNWPLDLVWQDNRKEYGEDRYLGFGQIDGRLYAICYTIKTDNSVRIISMRKANMREVDFYEETIQTND